MKEVRLEYPFREVDLQSRTVKDGSGWRVERRTVTYNTKTGKVLSDTGWAPNGMRMEYR